MRAVLGPVNGAARRAPGATAVARSTAGPERASRALGIQGLLRIGELSLKAADRRAFSAAVLDSVVNSLDAEAALFVTRGATGDLVRRQAGSPTLTRRLATHIQAMVGAGTEEPLTWIGEERGLGVLGAVVPESGQAQVILCIGRDPHGHPFLRREKELLLGYAQTTALVIERIRLQESLERQSAQVMSAFVSALASRNGYLQGHSMRVALYAEEVARVMGFSTAELGVARRSGLLHDLGKLATPDCILLKPAPLTEDEYAHIKHHPVAAAALLEPYGFLARESDAVKGHHERFDGTGYPDGLMGADIPLAARVVAVADAFDAMTSDRPYRRALPLERARQEIRDGAGGQFDPAVVDAWLSIPEGRLVAMSQHGDAGRDSILRLLTTDSRPSWG
jgi:putative nucleotidyltransferase with HDIG domain